MSDTANTALTKSIVKDKLSPMAQDLAEAALDSILDEGVLKEIPVVSWLFRARAIGHTIRDRIFLKKVGCFLYEASRLSAEERQKFSQRLAEDPNFEERCGESALLLIDKLADTDKARLMGYVFRRFVQGSIDEVTLHRIYAALEYFPYWQLLDLPRYYFKEGLTSLGQGAAALYQSLWLVEIFYGEKVERLHMNSTLQGSQMITYHEPFYRETHVGRLVAEVIRDFLDEPDQA